MLLDDFASSQVDRLIDPQKNGTAFEGPEAMDVEPAIQIDAEHAIVDSRLVEERLKKMKIEPKEQVPESITQEMDIDPEHRQETDETEIEIEEDEKTLSTRDSRSPSISRHSPMHSKEETHGPTISRRVTFAESTETRRITSVPRKVSLPSQEEKSSCATESSSFNNALTFSDPRPISSYARQLVSQGPPRTPAAQNTIAPAQITLPTYHGLSSPATVLLTNSHDEWSNFCVGLGHDGNVDIVDTRLHDSAKGQSMVWSHEYTATFAVLGAWISPGELALVHQDCRKNKDGSQICLIKYNDTQLKRRPQITPLQQSPHSHETKVTAIAPLWIKDGRRTFATGGIMIQK